MGRRGRRERHPHPDPEGELRSVSRTLRRDTGLLGALAARIRPYVADVPDADRLLAPVDDYLLICPGLADAWDPDCGLILRIRCR
ncbi:hypothetical protein SALBM217S_04949 [Streptomyces griseoloalbus]